MRGTPPAHAGASAAAHATSAHSRRLMGRLSSVGAKAARLLPDALDRVKRSLRGARVDRPHDAETSALALARANLDRAAVIGDDAVADHEAESRALVGILRREERVEDLVDVLGRDS